jgi:hypothetical protein
MKRPERGRALFYSRDSGGRHLTTPSEYVIWAAGEARRLGLLFDGLPGTIDAMIQSGRSHDGDLFLDFAVSGHLLSRPGLNELLAEAERDQSVSHIMIPRRDRFARPDDPLDAIAMENALRRSGITLVFMDRVCPPIARGQRVRIEDALGTYLDYDRAGQDRAELAKKIIYAQLSLAKAGYSTGGRAPYGFRRWLLKDDGTMIRQLQDGEHVKMRDHHVVLLPGPHNELTVIRRILKLLRSMPASRIAKLLTDEGVLAPDAGRSRTDNGVKHFTSGAWHATTISNIARNSLLVAICTYGRRSMGDQLRQTANGPRALDSNDFRADEKPKVIRNPDDAMTRTAARFEALVDLAEHQELIKILDERGASQRGKPRSRDPNKNPLGARIFDMNCGWPMYRIPRGESFAYTCAKYMQSRQCDHNRVNGRSATRFAMSCLRQRLASPTVLEKLTKRLYELAARERHSSIESDTRAARQAELGQVRMDLAKAERNLALAENPEQYRSVASVFETLRQQEARLLHQIEAESGQSRCDYDPDAEVDAAIEILHRLPDLVANVENLSKIGEAFRIVNIRVFLRLQKVRLKKRTLNKLAGGVVTFGDTPPPVALYAGPTGRRALAANNAATVAANSGRAVGIPNGFVSGREGNSLGNISRGDWRSFEPLIAAVVDAVLSPTPETVVSARIIQLSA